MTETKRPGSDTPPENPADQPKPPKHEECEKLSTPGAPTPPDPKPCPENPNCKCPKGPSSDPNCLEKLIAEQAAALLGADKAKTFKADLEALLTKAKAAGQEYTQEKYDKLVKQWIEQDAQIVELIRKLVCAVPCWECIIECYVCPLLNEMHQAEERLFGDGTLYTDVKNLYDLQYWRTRDKEAKDRQYNRVKAVLAAWEKPAQTIEKALADHAKLISDANAALGTSPSKVVYDVFLKLVPLHLAIAPPRDDAKYPERTTRIDKKYTELCQCDTGSPDDCCGPDVGQATLRQRAIGPQPYLVDPKEYFSVICCLVENRYKPAKEALSLAEGDLLTVDNEIKRLKALVENGLKSLDKDARAAIPTDVKCSDIEKGGESPSSQAR